MDSNLFLILLGGSVAAFTLALVSAVAGFGGGVLALPIFSSLLGVRTAIPVLTFTQLASNASRVWLNRSSLNWEIIRRFAYGAIPLALVGGFLFSTVPLDWLQRILGLFLFDNGCMEAYTKRPRKPSLKSFTGIGAVSGIGSALLGSVGPLTAPFFLAYGLVRSSYIGTEAACALVMHLTKIVAYGATSLIDARVLLLGAVFTPATIAGAWVGKKLANRMSDKVFIVLVEIGLVFAGVVFLVK